MFEHVLRRFLEHSSRRLIVVTLTFVIGLLAVWPAVDEYLALLGEHAELNAAIASTEKTLSRLGTFEEKVVQRVTELSAREAEAISDDGAQAFRARVVDWAREKGCQVRRINLSDPRVRKWREKDNPLEKTSRGANGKETKFDLRTQQFRLTVTGAVRDITALMGEFQKGGKLIYTSGFSLRPTPQDRKTAEVEIELILFDLVDNSAVTT